MSVLRFDITLSDGSTESFATDAERVLIGRGAHCDIRLPDGESAVEHVVIEVVGGTLRIVARAFTPPPTLNGDTVTEATVTGDALVGIGAVQIRISQVEASLDRGVARPPRGNHALRLVILAAALVLGGMLFLRAQRATKPAPGVVPELWSGTATPCPVTAPGQARALAAEKRIVADGKRERHPFYASDGVEAVVLYEVAAACFTAAGDAANAAEVSTAASELRSDVNEDFRVRRLRLERALASENDEVAAHEVVMLRTLMVNKQGSYIDWIHTLARKLEVDKEAQ